MEYCTDQDKNNNESGQHHAGSEILAVGCSYRHPNRRGNEAYSKY